MRRQSLAGNCFGLLAATCASSIPAPASAQPATAADAVLRVVDIGAGLCVVITAPGGGAMVYDAGPKGDRCAAVVREMVPGHALDLVVLSHSDSDHIGGMRRILKDNRVVRIIHPGDDHSFKRPPNGKAYLELMREDIVNEGAQVWNLADPSTPPAPGRRFTIGAASATFVAGWSDGKATRHANEGSLPEGPRNNALSIVIRFEFRGHSVLLTGDTVGRLDFTPPATCAYAERVMVERAATVPIRSDVLVGQHHGADNASSNCFIGAVRPSHVVFSAGHVVKYHHPRQSAYDRFLHFNSSIHLLRTDRGDNEGGTGPSQEAVQGSGNCPDPVGDDDVEIILPGQQGQQVHVDYRGSGHACPT